MRGCISEAPGTLTFEPPPRQDGRQKMPIAQAGCEVIAELLRYSAPEMCAFPPKCGSAPRDYLYKMLVFMTLAAQA